MTTILLIGAGGFLGANVRFAIASWSRRRYGSRFPVGTMIANVAGSFLIGLILGMIDDREARLLLATGFLGAETTFSTFAVETLGLADRDERNEAAANVALNGVGSMLAVVAGLALAWLLRVAA
jgi:CrcB protein